MDERQTQIKEGAGLEENRINQDLVDFLNKWSSPFLFVLLIVVAGFWAYRWWEGYQLKRVNEAFATYELTIAGGSPNPDSLTQIADDYAGVRAVPALANLRKADLYLRAATVGLEPGASPDPRTGEFAEGDLLDDGTKTSYLESAASIYAGVADAAENSKRWVIAANACYGLAAAHASLGRAEQAQAALDRAKSIAEEGGYTDLLAMTGPWMDVLLPEGETRLFNQDELPTPETDDADAPADGTEPDGDADAAVTDTDIPPADTESGTEPDADTDEPTSDDAAGDAGTGGDEGAGDDDQP